MISKFSERKNIAILVILFLIIFSWVGNLNRSAAENRDQELLLAVAFFAASIAIDASISVIQSLELSGGIVVGGATLSVGEILDPVNDLVEDVTDIMVLVIGSFVLQKMLLLVTANKVFSGLLTIIGVLTIYIISSKRFKSQANVNQSSGMLFKLFILLVVIRFSLGAAIWMNNSVEKLLFSTQLQKTTTHFSNIETSLFEGIRLSEEERKKLKLAMNSDETAVKSLQTIEIPKLLEEIANIKGRLAKSKSDLDGIKGQRKWKERLNPLANNPEIKQAKKNLSRLSDQKITLEGKLETKKATEKALLENISSRTSELSDDGKGIMSKVKYVKNNLSPSIISAKISGFIEYYLTILVIYILKSIIFPLGFFYMLMHMAKVAWRTDWESYLEPDAHPAATS